jgi:hypothetical protein
MPNVRKEPEVESGMKRAADFQEGFMGVPGYSDDSLLSVVRYVSQVQVSLEPIFFYLPCLGTRSVGSWFLN